MEIGRHINRCSVCKHPEKGAIERDYLAFVSMAECERRYALPKNSMAYHVRAYKLDERLGRNKPHGLLQIAALGLTHLKPGDVTAANVVAALQLHAKLQGELVDRTEDVTVRLESASDAELSFYEVHGRLPKPEELAEFQDGSQEPQ